MPQTNADRRLLAPDHQTWHRNVPPWVLETHLFCDQKSKVKGHCHEAKKYCRRG